VSGEYSAADEAFNLMRPSTFLFWEAIQKAMAEGFTTFDFGRTSFKNVKLMDFKRRWATEATDLPQFIWPRESVDHFYQDDRSMKYRLTRGMIKFSPRLLQKPMGEFIYRHMG
jgi:lipid II:glycine glycyltransferase (peptidoglycan interpeptide bridge formation enzyme)